MSMCINIQISISSSAPSGIFESSIPLGLVCPRFFPPKYILKTEKREKKNPQEISPAQLIPREAGIIHPPEARHSSRSISFPPRALPLSPLLRVCILCGSITPFFPALLSAAVDPFSVSLFYLPVCLFLFFFSFVDLVWMGKSGSLLLTRKVLRDKIEVLLLVMLLLLFSLSLLLLSLCVLYHFLYLPTIVSRIFFLLDAHFPQASPGVATTHQVTS